MLAQKTRGSEQSEESNSSQGQGARKEEQREGRRGGREQQHQHQKPYPHYKSYQAQNTEGIQELLRDIQETVTGPDLSPRAYRDLLQKAAQAVQEVQARDADKKHQFTDPLFQEIRTLTKAIYQNTLPQNQRKPNTQTWAGVAAKEDNTAVTIRIQDKEERREIAGLSSEELVQRIGRKEIVGAKQAAGGNIKVYTTGQGAKKDLERLKGWTEKIAQSARVTTPTFQILVHGIPLTIDPTQEEQLLEFQRETQALTPGSQIKRAAWLKKKHRPEQTHGSLIVWLETGEQANRILDKGFLWKAEVKTAEIFKSSFRTMQCFQCQGYGHIAPTCTANPRCGKCAQAHNTKECTTSTGLRCAHCGKKHPAWDQSCPAKITAQAKATAQRTGDAGRYQTEEDKSQGSSDGWQEAGGKKRKFLHTQEGQRRSVGRPRKLDQPEANQAKLAEKIFFPQTQTHAQQPSNFLAARDNIQNLTVESIQQSPLDI